MTVSVEKINVLIQKLQAAWNADRQDVQTYHVCLLALHFGTRFGYAWVILMKFLFWKSENEIAMKRKEEIRNKWLHIRLNDAEYKKIESFWKSSTCNQLSDYARTTLLKKPVTVKYRNASADEILSEMIRLKNELNAIGNNFNQAVHKLHTLDHIPQFKIWVVQNEIVKQNFVHKVEEISVRMHQIYEVWSQK